MLQSLRTAIAVTLNALGDCEEAEATYREVAAEYAEALGPEHHDALIPRRGLAEAFRNQGRLEEADEEACVAKTYKGLCLECVFDIKMHQEAGFRMVGREEA